MMLGRLAAALLLLLAAGSASAETLKIAVGQRGNWDTSISALGQLSGIMNKHGLTLEILYTAGGGETQQAVLSRSVDIGVAAGTLGVLGAASKGAPIRMIGGEVTGASELFWYVPAASPIKTPADMNGKTVAYSTTGSSTNTVVLMEQAQDNLHLTPVATGGLPSTFTQTMSGQIDVGWSAAPFGVEALQKGAIRIVFRGSDVKAASDQTIRALITHAAVLDEKRDAIERYLAAYRETLDWMYSSPDAIPMYAKFAGISPEIAKQTRDEFFPKSALEPTQIAGLDSLMADGVRLKFLSAPLSQNVIDKVVVAKELMK